MESGLRLPSSAAQPDFGRAVLPHRDPTFDAVARLLQDGSAFSDWCITGPRLFGPSAAPAVPDQAVALHLQPAVAQAVLQYSCTSLSRSHRGPARASLTA